MFDKQIKSYLNEKAQETDGFNTEFNQILEGIHMKNDRPFFKNKFIYKVAAFVALFAILVPVGSYAITQIFNKEDVKAYSKIMYQNENSETGEPIGAILFSDQYYYEKDENGNFYAAINELPYDLYAGGNGSLPLEQANTPFISEEYQPIYNGNMLYIYPFYYGDYLENPREVIDNENSFDAKFIEYGTSDRSIKIGLSITTLDYMDFVNDNERFYEISSENIFDQSIDFYYSLRPEFAYDDINATADTEHHTTGYYWVSKLIWVDGDQVYKLQSMTQDVIPFDSTDLTIKAPEQYPDDLLLKDTLLEYAKTLLAQE